MSSRAQVLKTLANSASKIKTGGGYLVKRGAINWVTFDWDQYSRGISIVQDEGMLFDNPESIGKDGRFSMEAFMKMPSSSANGIYGNLPEIDDDALDDLIDDMRQIVNELITAMINKYQVIFKMDPTQVTFIEAHDVELQVQGVVVSFSASY